MKLPKTPPLSSKTKLLSFDLETNGLHGQAFAIGAVVVDRHGKIDDEFSARCKINGKIDPWVKKNVMPVLSDMPITQHSYKNMCDDFWRWYVEAEKSADYVLVNNGYPVEYRFLLDCQQVNLNERYWQHPFPILELSSLALIAKHMAKTNSKIAKRGADLSEIKYLKHHPLQDAINAAREAFRIFELIGR